jgi:hypothetical protein
MLHIQAPSTKTITPERKQLAEELFNTAGFDDNTYAAAETIDAARQWVLANMDKLSAILPKHVLGDLSGLQSDKYRRTLMAFIRRMAQFLHGSVTRKRIQFTNANGGNSTKYLYKIIF